MISRIRILFALALLPLLLAACGVHSTPQTSGELGRKFAATVPGIWEGGLSRGGKQVRMYKQFLPDGRAQGVLIVKQTGGGVSFVMPEIPFSSRWRVKGDVVETYDIKTGIPGLFKPGEVMRDRLVSVSQNRIVSRSEKSGGLEIITRVKSGR